MAAPTAFSRLLGEGVTIRVGTGSATASSSDIINNDDVIGGNLDGEAELVTAQPLGVSYEEHATKTVRWRMNVQRMVTTGYPLSARIGTVVYIKLVDGQSSPQTIWHGQAMIRTAECGEFEKEALLTESISAVNYQTPITEPAV